MHLPAPPPGAITATPHRPSPFMPPTSSFGAFGALTGSGGIGGASAAAAAGAGNPAAAAAAAAAADYASWLCRPLAGLPGNGSYLPLPANILAARLSKLKDFFSLDCKN